MQLEGEKPYEYKDPIQQPIAPPYASFLKHKFPTQSLDEVDVDQAVTDTVVKILGSCKPSTSDTSDDPKSASDNINLDEIVDKLKVLGKIPDIPKDYKLPEDCGLFPCTTDFFEDFTKKVAAERTKHSDQKFCHSVLLCDAEPAEIQSTAIQMEQADYRNYVGSLLQQQERECNATNRDPLPEFMKVVRQALFGDKPINKDEFLGQLDEAVKIDNKKEFFFECTCDEDSDIE